MTSLAVLIDTLEVGGHSTSLLAQLRSWSEDHPDLRIDVIHLGPPGALAGEVPAQFRLLAMPRRWHWTRGRRVAESLLTGNFLTSVAIRWRRARARGSREAMSVMALSQLYSRRQLRTFSQLSQQYDVAISWSELGSMYVLATKILARTKIGWIHPDYRQAAFHPDLDRPFLEALDYVVAVSRTGRDSLVSSFPGLSSCVLAVRNRVDRDRISTLSTAGLGCDSRLFGGAPPTMVTVARLHDQSKALLRGVELCRRLVVNGVDLHWVIVGDGPDRGRLDRAIRESDLTGVVTLVGSRDNPYPYVAAADLFVLQSYYEGMPMVVDEALALGVPVLVTEYSSAREQVRDGVDGLVVANEEMALLNAMTALLTDPARLSALRARCGGLTTEPADDRDIIDGLLG